jgi:hypothetical protein
MQPHVKELPYIEPSMFRELMSKLSHHSLTRDTYIWHCAVQPELYITGPK